MASNTFGKYFRWTTFGESHGAAMGVVIDGCPSGLEFDTSLLEKQLERRRPGRLEQDGSQIVSARNEGDKPKVLSGVFEGKTLGTPLTIVIENNDPRSKDYEKIKSNPRPGHADQAWKDKFGHVDPRGGGRSSGRETVSRVAAGAVAEMLVKSLEPKTQVLAYSQQISEFTLTQKEELSIESSDQVDQFIARFPSAKDKQVGELLLKAKTEGESFAGVVGVQVKNCPANLGEPVFEKLKSRLASALMSIGATNGIEFGIGFAASSIVGTEFHSKSSNYGGILGGISTGENLNLRVSFKPTSSIMDVAKKGRHDPCIVPRACVVVESMVWSVLADTLLAVRLNAL